MKRLIAGALAVSLLAGGTVLPASTPTMATIAIMKMNDGTYSILNLTEAQYQQLGNTGPVQFPTIANGAFLVAARIPLNVGSTTAPVMAWDSGGQQITIKDAGGNAVIPKVDTLNSTTSTLAAVVLGHIHDTLTPDFSQAAIAVASSSRGVRISANSISFRCTDSTVSGSNLLMLLEVGDNNVASVNEWLTVTVHGISTTSTSFIDRAQESGGGQGNFALYAFFNPDETSAGACFSTLGNSATHILDSMQVTYSGAVQSGSWNKSATSILSAYQNATTSSAGTTFTQTTTPCADNSWLFEATQNDTAGANTAAGTNYTTRQMDASGAVSIGDTGPITPAAATSMSTTTTASSNWQGIQVSIAPFGATCSGGGGTGSSNIDDGGWFEVLY